MATTKISQIIIRKDDLANVPVLSAGEFMLAGDEQRLFLGQEPVTGVVSSSTTTEASVTFSVNTAGILTPLDLDAVSEYSIVVTKASDSSTITIPSANVTANDTVLTFNHGLGGAVAGADTFVLNYNKEVTSYKAERDIRRLATKFTNSGGVVKTTGIDFLSSVKNDINIDYALFNAIHMRKGTLTVLVNGASSASIEDNFIGDSQLSDVEFSITNDGAGTFTLNFNTALTSQLQFNYTQTSSKFVTS